MTGDFDSPELVKQGKKPFLTDAELRGRPAIQSATSPHAGLVSNGKHGSARCLAVRPLLRFLSFLSLSSFPSLPRPSERASSSSPPLSIVYIPSCAALSFWIPP